jgi:hypothetical protein
MNKILIFRLFHSNRVKIIARFIIQLFPCLLAVISSIVNNLPDLGLLLTISGSKALDGGIDYHT